jgi:hypothetical protein
MALFGFVAVRFMALRVSSAGLVLAVLGLALTAGGCASGPRVVKVSGTVTRGGKPVDRLVVNFTPEQEGKASWGITDKDGRYTLKYERDRDGALVGTHKVWFQVRAATPKEEIALAAGELKVHPEILQKYGNPKTTPLRVEVKGDDQPLDLKLD